MEGEVEGQALRNSVLSNHAGMEGQALRISFCRIAQCASFSSLSNRAMLAISPQILRLSVVFENLALFFSRALFARADELPLHRDDAQAIQQIVAFAGLDAPPELNPKPGWPNFKGELRCYSSGSLLDWRRRFLVAKTPIVVTPNMANELGSGTMDPVSVIVKLK